MGAGVLSSVLHRRDGSLCCEGVPLAEIAASVGTPAYVYSSASIRQQFAVLDAVLQGVPHRIHYSLKANANLAILQLLRSLGAGADVVSGGELYRARRAGFAPDEIVFGGVGKSDAELGEGLDAGVLLFNAESEEELRRLNRLAGARGARARVALRVNPEITVETPHAYTRTGEKGHKFGIPYDDAASAARVAASLPNLVLTGLDMHVGSQLSRLDAVERGVERMVSLHATLVASGVGTVRFLDIGGGLAVPYDGEATPDLAAYGRLVRAAAERTGLRILVEPGRFLVAAAGVLLARVLYRKRSGGREIAIVDAGMTDLLRPSHYHAYHHIELVAGADGRAPARLDVVGPVCESGDFLALDRELPNLVPGDLVAVHTVGAYGFVMSSNYNSRPRVVEVMVDGERYAEATARETYADLVRLEHPELDWRSIE